MEAGIQSSSVEPPLGLTRPRLARDGHRPFAPAPFCTRWSGAKGAGPANRPRDVETCSLNWVQPVQRRGRAIPTPRQGLRWTRSKTCRKS